MDDQRKHKPPLIGLGIRREVASAKNQSTKIKNRTLSFAEWMDKRSVSHISRRPASSPRTQNQQGQLKECWPEVTHSPSSASASKDWIPPNKLPNNNFQIHHKQPPKVPFMARNDGPSTINKSKLPPKPSSKIPTRPASGLKRKSIGSEQAQPNKSPSVADNLVCKLCQIICSGPLTMRQHLKGRPHKAKLMYMKMKRGPKGRPKCEVCQIWCSDWAGLDSHFKGQKHKTKLQELEVCKNKRVSKSVVTCELCLKGRQHAVRKELGMF